MIPTLPSALSPSGPHPSLSPLSHPASTLTVHLHHERPPHSRQAKNGELRRQLRRTESTAAAGFVKDVVLKFLLAGDEARPRCTRDGRCTKDGREMHGGRWMGDAREIHTHARRTSYLVQCTLHVLCMCTDYAWQAHKTHFELLASVLQFSPREIAQVHAACTPHVLTAHVCSAACTLQMHQCVNTCACTLQVHAAKELEAFHGSTTALISSFFFAPSDLAAAGGGASGAAEGAEQGKPSFDSTMQAYQQADAAGAAAAAGGAAVAAVASSSEEAEELKRKVTRPK